MLRIGNVEIEFPVVQAALAGYSDWPMRTIARRLGAPLTMAEVMLDKFVVEVRRGARWQRYLKTDGHPCGGQLMGSKDGNIAGAARRLVEAGFDLVDVNFACPVKKVVGKCRGGSLLAHPEDALAIFSRVRNAVPPEVPVTVKLRRGFDDSEESRDRFFQIFDGVFERGAAAATVHGRTVRQKYDGRADWNFLKELKEYAGPDRVVLGSGDLVDARACLDMIEQTGVDGVTAARGAIGNPWIFRQAMDLAAGREMHVPSTGEQGETLAEHYRLAEEIYGEERGCRIMRKFGIYYAKHHERKAAVRQAFIGVKTSADWPRLLAEYYGIGPS